MTAINFSTKPPNWELRKADSASTPNDQHCPVIAFQGVDSFEQKSATEATTSFLEKLSKNETADIQVDTIKTVPLVDGWYDDNEKPIHAYEKEITIEGSPFRMRVFWRSRVLGELEGYRRYVWDKVYSLASEERISFTYKPHWYSRKLKTATRPAVYLELIRNEYLTQSERYNQHNLGQLDRIKLGKTEEMVFLPSAYKHYRLHYVNNTPNAKANRILSGSERNAAAGFFFDLEEKTFKK